MIMTSVPPRKEPARACKNCHARKIKCDLTTHKTSVCSNCRSLNLACREHQPRRRQIRALSREDNAPPLSTRSPIEASPEDVSSVEHRDAYERYATLGPGDDRPIQIKMAGNTSFKDLSRDDSVLLSFLTQNFKECQAIEEYQVTFVDDASPSRFLGPELGSEGFEKDVYHYRDAPFVRRVAGSIPKSITAAEISTLSSYGAFTLPSRHIISVFTQSFLDRVYPIFPIIDESKTLDHLNSILGGNVQQPIVPLLLLQTILLAGAAFFHNEKLALPQDEILARLHGRAKALINVGFEQDRLTLVQVYLLLSTYNSDSNDDTLHNGWLPVGSAVRIAQGLGMHRNLGRAKASISMRRQWKRIWWTLFLHDTMVSFSWGRPRAIHAADFDVTELTEEDLISTRPGALPRTEHTHVFLSLCNLGLILSEWMDMSRPKRNSSEQDPSGFEKLLHKLLEWHDGLHVTLREPQVGHYTLWTATIHVTYHAALIRFTEKVHHNREAVLQSAQSILAICRSLDQQNLLESIWNHGVFAMMLAAARFARELIDVDSASSFRGFISLQEILPLFVRLTPRSSMASQNVILYSALLEKKVDAMKLGVDIRTHMGLKNKTLSHDSDLWGWMMSEAAIDPPMELFDMPNDFLASLPTDPSVIPGHSSQY